jgi:hypothetical protein
MAGAMGISDRTDKMRIGSRVEPPGQSLYKGQQVAEGDLSQSAKTGFPVSRAIPEHCNASMVLNSASDDCVTLQLAIGERASELHWLRWEDPTLNFGQAVRGQQWRTGQLDGSVNTAAHQRPFSNRK